MTPENTQTPENNETPQDNNNIEEPKPLTLLEVASSCLAAAFGVQSKKNKERDFTRGKPMQFLVVGIVFTALFLATVIGIVSLVLP